MDTESASPSSAVGAGGSKTVSFSEPALEESATDASSPAVAAAMPAEDASEEAALAALMMALAAVKSGNASQAEVMLVNCASPDMLNRAGRKARAAAEAMGLRDSDLDDTPDTAYDFIRFRPARVPAAALQRGDGEPPLPTFNADFDLAAQGRAGPPNVVLAHRRLLMDRVLRALFEGETGFPSQFKSVAKQGGGPASRNFLDDGILRVPLALAHVLLGDDGQEKVHVFKESSGQGVLVAARFVRVTAPWKRVLTRVTGVPRFLSQEEVFGFFQGVLGGSLVWSDMRQDSVLGGALTSAAEGVSRLSLEELAGTHSAWKLPGSPAQCQSEESVRTRAYYVTTRFDKASTLAPRMMLATQGGETFVLGCTGEAVTGCSSCGARDHTDGSCSGKQLGHSMLCYSLLGARILSPKAAVPPAAAAHTPAAPASRTPSPAEVWQEVRVKRRARPAAAQHQHGQRRQRANHAPGAAPTPAASATSRRSLWTSTPHLGRGGNQAAVLPSGAPRASRTTPTGILHKSTPRASAAPHPAQATAVSASPASGPARSYAEAAVTPRREPVTPRKPGTKRAPEGSLSPGDRRPVIPHPDEAAEGLNLTLDPDRRTLSAVSGESPGLTHGSAEQLLWGQQQAGGPESEDFMF